MPCKKCGGSSLVRDDVSGSLFCDSCGAVQAFDNYDTRAGINDPQGVFVRLGTSGTGSVLNYRDKKIYEANKLIDDLAFKLDLSERKVSEIKSMVDSITEGEYGQGDWFSVLIAACAYIVMRNDNKSFSMEEIGHVIACDVHELGRMIMRVLDHLDIKMPEFDIVGSFERVVRNLSALSRIESDKIDRIRKQGVFLMQCSMKWFLTTGRRPLPIVVAILVLVAELNGVKDVKIEQVAREVHTVVSTCRLRYKELLETLVKVAQVLPWGKDVNVKNVVKNAPFVIRYMEMKSREKCNGGGDGLKTIGFDFEEVVAECLRKDYVYGDEEGSVEKDYDSKYFQAGRISESDESVDELQLSHECLSMVYEKFSHEIGHHDMHVGDSGPLPGSKRQRGYDFDFDEMEWWSGKSELSKKLMLKEVLEKNVGYDPMPPSFLKGLLANEKRRAKINAAKLRISKIMQPCDGDSRNNRNVEDAHAEEKKRKKKTRVNEIDWEDFIIETLLLHQVREDEIEKGQYNTLLDLHVFNAGVM